MHVRPVVPHRPAVHVHVVRRQDHREAHQVCADAVDEHLPVVSLGTRLGSSGDRVSSRMRDRHTFYASRSD